MTGTTYSLEEPDDERLRRERAGALMQLAMDLRHLPDFLPGEPSGIAAASVASQLAPIVVDELAALYDVRTWTPDEFVRAYVEGALSAWKPGTRVERSSSALRIISPVCPVGAEVELDARTCQMCRALHAEVARRAIGATVEFEELISRGEAACTTTVKLRPPGAPV